MKIKTQTGKEKQGTGFAHANTNRKKAGVVLLISERDFRANNITRDKKNKFHNDKGTKSSRGHNNSKGLCFEIHEAKTNRLQEKMNKYTIRDTNTPLSIMNRKNRQKSVRIQKTRITQSTKSS